MNINVEETIEGLWIANERTSYLSFWFPILKKRFGNYVEIKPGMNVIYGMNGSGKTQLLEAISCAAEFRVSTFEGFILKDPIIETSGKEQNRKLFDTSARKILSYFDSITEESYAVDMMLGWIKGYKPENLKDENRAEVEEIISEFINNKKCLLTRAIPEDKISFDVHNNKDSMKPAHCIDFVPILLPTDDAPITRAHLAKISDSFLGFCENLDGLLDQIQDLDLSDEIIVEEKKTELFEEWLESWNWSPIINLRNFGFLTNYNYELFDRSENSEFGFLNGSRLPIFLPAIHSNIKDFEYQEFEEEVIETNFALSLKREEGAQEFTSVKEYYLSNSDIGLSQFGKNRETNRSILVDRYLFSLRAKIRFLPGLRALTADSELSESDNEIQLLLNETPRVPASAGSQAEKRWLLLGKKAMRQSTKWLVIDEPESGMHRTAEAELASVLSSPDWVTNSILVVASHSPEFLNLPNVNIIHVVKGATYTLKNIDREALGNLGIRPSDLLAGTKAFLLVEGEHEKIIFETLFQDELERIKCRIIVARGGKNMKDIFESQFIFDFTDAVIISLLDNIDSKVVEDVWNESKKLAQSGRIIEAGQFVRHSLPGSKSGENVFLSQFLTLALANGSHERVEVFGLSKPDIIFYFNPEDFGLKKSWEQLLVAHALERESFKLWASKKFNADFSVLAIANAALNCKLIPVDFGNLIMKIAAVTNRQP